MASSLSIPKYTVNEIQQSLCFFAENGFVIYKDVYSNEVIGQCSEFIDNACQIHSSAHIDNSNINFLIMKSLARTDLFNSIEHSEMQINILKEYLGPDIAKLGGDHLSLIRPTESSNLVVKNLHSDAWTGTSVNTIFWNLFFTDANKENTLGVCPGSHALGNLPVKNRNLDADVSSLNLDCIALDTIKQGNVVLWHPFLLHFTTGTSAVRRSSVVMRFTSTQTPFSSQEKSLGYKSISNGPLSYVMRLVGSDYASPYRVLGGVPAIDKRLEYLYPCSKKLHIK
ncbi:phytanoyl-CoA dioxygenase family protein [Synechococcus sp. PROS-U-1]|nr:phytanoyl-CoA dioxygenase family protein [Synechococcus sp. PROS-U-1]